MARRIALLIPALALLLLPASAASAADPLDIVAATAQNTSDRLAADAAYLDHTSDAGGKNVTCTKPYVSAQEVQPYRDLVVAETHQTDLVTAAAECVSLTGSDVGAMIEVRIEYCPIRTSLTTCPMYPTGFGNTAQAVAIGGTATLAVNLTAVYPDLHPAIGKIRRAWACVRTSLTGSDCVTYDYSGVYGG